MKQKPKIPEYFKDLPDDANLNSRDVAKIFGYKNSSSITLAYQRGIIPKPDASLNSKMRNYPNKNNIWKLSTIREWIKKTENDNRNIPSKT